MIIRTACAGCTPTAKNVFYYLTLYNENYAMPAMPEGVEEGILKGLYKFKPGTEGEKVQSAHLSAAGRSLREALRAQEILAERLRCLRRRLERDELQAAARRRAAHQAMEHAASDRSRRKSLIWNRFCRTKKACFVAVSDYMKMVPDQIAPVGSRRADDVWARTASVAAIRGPTCADSSKSTPNSRR